MQKLKTRNFGCPETNEPCTDGGCTKERCRERERLQNATTKEANAKNVRLQRAKDWEIIGPILLRSKSH